MELGLPYDEMCSRMHRTIVPQVMIAGDSGSPSNASDSCRVVTRAAFVREFVAASRPCILKNMMSDWRAVTLWQDDEYLFPLSAKNNVSIALTPNGRADCITRVAHLADRDKWVTDHLFMSACDVQGTMRDFQSMLKAALAAHGPQKEDPFNVDLACESKPPVPYIQLQNNSLPLEFSHLSGDVGDSVVAFGTDVFGVPPDATNLWVGSSLSVSSMHQDWYENLYGVVRGMKRFTLIAPWEGAARLPKRRARAASYDYSPSAVAGEGDQWICSPSLKFSEIADAGEVRDAEEGKDDGPPPGYVDWIDVDVEDTPKALWPDVTRCVRSVTVDVHAGDVLYLPAMWYHRVAQVQRSDDWCVVAVNYWFDMNFESPLFELQAMLRSAAFPQKS